MQAHRDAGRYSEDSWCTDIESLLKKPLFRGYLIALPVLFANSEEHL